MAEPLHHGPPLPPLDPEQLRPVFVVGMNGSGTTMLVESLGRHPRLYAFPRETRAFPQLITALQQFGDLATDENFLELWNTVASLPEIQIKNGMQPVPIPSNWREHPRTLATVIDAVMRHFACQQGKSRWAEKTPQHVLHISTLAELFPQAQFIHIIRDGRDCAASFHRRWKRTPALTIRRWRHAVREGRKQGERLGPRRYLEVHYERLTEDPEQWMRRICAFLDLPFHPEVLKSSWPQSDRRGKEDTIRPNADRWRSYFSAREVRRLEAIAGHTLAEMGYSVSTEGTDSDPPRAALRYWTLRDGLRQASYYVWKKASGEYRDHSWRIIFSLILQGIRQQIKTKTRG